MPDGFKYRAFISYAHADEAWAGWIHQRLERYRVPSRLVGKMGAHGPVPRRIGRCFRDQAELSAASHLGGTLRQALRDAQALIIVCSPRSATSAWVNEEIEYFRSIGRGDHIFALVVDGEPNASDASQECFPPSLLVDEPLAADARAGRDGKNNAFLKLAAGLIGVGFDELRLRERGRRRRAMIATAAVSLAIAAVTTFLAVNAWQSHNVAAVRQQQSDDLIGFLLELKGQYEKLGRLDMLDSTMAKAMSYLGKVDLATADIATLDQRAQALSIISELQYAQHKLPEAVESGRDAIATARELRRRSPGDRADFLLAQAERAFGEPSLEGEDFEHTEPLTREGYEIAARLQAAQPADPERAYLKAMLDDQLAYIKAYGPMSQLDPALALWRDCADVLHPVAEAAAADSKFISFEVRCETQRAMALETYQASADWSAFLARAEEATRRFPRDLSVLSSTQLGRAGAVVSYVRSGQLDQAQIVSQGALANGQRLTAVDPENMEWQRDLANALQTDAQIQRDLENWDRAQADLDQALGIFERLRAQAPASSNLRYDQLGVRRLRAELAFARSADAERALEELAAGVALVRPDETDSSFPSQALLLYLLQWALAEGKHPQIAAEAKQLTRTMLERIGEGLEPRRASQVAAEIAYNEGRFDDAERMYASLREAKNPYVNYVTTFRVLACKRQGRECAARAAPRPR